MTIDEKAYELLRDYKSLAVQKYTREFEEYDLFNYAPEDRRDALWKYIEYRFSQNETYILMREKIHKKRT